MSLARGKFGIEYNPRQVDDESSGLGWVIALVVLVASVSLVWTLVSRYRAMGEEFTGNRPEIGEAVPAVPEAASNGVQRAEPPAPPPRPVVESAAISERPVKVRHLLMRLEEAEKKRDLEMAVTTIETIRNLPGTPAADLDDALARRLGQLNFRRLFVMRNAQWVREVTVGRGDSASRIARENGSTLASLAKLNGGSVDRIILGAKLYVMDHPRFNLVLHRRSRTADLWLNGKFFRRYDLLAEVSGKDGSYDLPDRKRAFFDRNGVRLRKADLDELDMLLPPHAQVLISEM